MSDLEYVRQRNAMRESRMRCLESIAAAFGCSADDLPREVRRAVVVHGHESFQLALAAEHEAHERATQPAPSVGAYREVPTRVDRLTRRAR